jgi:preprotein translocase subunit SecB
VELVGVFDIQGEVTDEVKKDFHVRCYQQLFPYVEILAKQVCAAGGMPNFLLLRQRMEPENVMLNKKEEPGQ